MAHSASCGLNAGCAGKTVLSIDSVHVSALETFRVEALYKSTTFSFYLLQTLYFDV